MKSGMISAWSLCHALYRSLVDVCLLLRVGSARSYGGEISILSSATLLFGYGSVY